MIYTMKYYLYQKIYKVILTYDKNILKNQYVSAEELYGGKLNEYEEILVIAHNFNNAD